MSIMVVPSPLSDLDESRLLVGIWVDSEEGKVWTAWRVGGQIETESEPFHGFAWIEGGLCDDREIGSLPRKSLAGAGSLSHLIEGDDSEGARILAQLPRNPVKAESVRPLEHQHLLRHGMRMIAPGFLGDVVRCQIDIETGCEDPNGFSDPKRKGDRVLAIGLRSGGNAEILELEEETDAAERSLLKRFGERLRAIDPDILEGHNFFNFDLNYLRFRCRRFKLPMEWGRFGAEARFRNSRVRIAERWFDLSRCDIPGRTVFDTLIAAQFYDLTQRSLPAFGLKDLALHFGLSGKDKRTYLPGNKIAESFRENRETFRAYLEDDLRETEGIATILLPTYVAQAAIFPMTLQEILLRGTGSRVEMVFLEEYFRAERALPEPQQSKSFEGAVSKSFETGVFHKVLHFDVASLYPSLLLHIGRNPKNDDLGVLIPALERLRAERLEYKKRSLEESDPALRREFSARQNSFKILINSFYGYLGFGGARFGDSELAAEVTKGGREILEQLIVNFQSKGCRVLEADTDGIYVEAHDWFETPERLLAAVNGDLPDGVDLEFDGTYEAMFCYKAKNYALLDGESVVVKGSALRSRGTEPFLRKLTNHLIDWLLGVREEDPLEEVRELGSRLEEHSIPVEELAKGEYLSQSPTSYEKAVAEKGKSRRASLEVALRMDPMPKMGERVNYYVGMADKKSTPEWQKARSLEEYDPITAPYDPGYYQSRIKSWMKRYGEFLSESEQV
ncbi:DNA polymerase domain-containing protein [Puniceicoccus vermicola]|nr:DNA polymerase domain-containing protein [Puniceicoccus vermicola]